MIAHSVVCRLPAVMLIAAVALSSLSFAADFADRTPSEQEIIEALDPPAPPPGTKLRGIIRHGANPNTTQPPWFSIALNFEFNSSKLGANETAKLTNIANALKSQRLSAKVLDVVGHTDAKGSAEYNMKLSQQRANSVVDYLTNQGVESGRLKTTGMGKSKLKNKANPYAAENRRVEFVVTN